MAKIAPGFKFARNESICSLLEQESKFKFTREGRGQRIAVRKADLG